MNASGLNLPPKGVIFDIKRYAIHDGPGIRTTVFLKGCPLNCPWCHNPEGIERTRQFLWNQNRCLACSDCIASCENGAITWIGDRPRIDYGRCIFCGACVKSCSANALTIAGQEASVSEVITEIEKDSVFFESSRGGVTFSGGEPLLQPEFLLALLKECKKRNFHTTIDTSGFSDEIILMQIAEYTDLFLYDVKMIDDEKHLKFTGVSNERILSNLRHLLKAGYNVIVRYPLIPGVNDTSKDICQLGEFILSAGIPEGVSILPFHQGGLEKAKRVQGTARSEFISTPLSSERIEGVEEALKEYGLKVQIGG